MASDHYELPKQILSLFNTIGPIQEDLNDTCTFHYKVEVIVKSDKSTIVGFLITCQPVEKQPPDDIGREPVVAKGEPTYIFTDTLENALAYMIQNDTQTVNPSENVA